MVAANRYESITRFCGREGIECPEMFLDHHAPDNRRVVIIDDFGQSIQLSLGQLDDLIAQVKSGALDELVRGP